MRESAGERETRVSTVLVVDDHDLARLGLRSLLSAPRDLRVVGEAASGEQALEESVRLMPDLVLMDLRMPGALDGIEATRAIMRDVPSARVLIVTMDESPVIAKAALDAGAAGCVQKSSSRKVLLSAVRRALRENVSGHEVIEAVSVETLKRAIAEDELEVYFQPQHLSSSGAIVGVEALARWQHPTLGLLPPARFISLAQRAGLIREVGRAVLCKAVAQCADWRSRGSMVRLSVNVSATELLDESFPEEVQALLRSRDLPPEVLTLELTEDTLVADIEEAVRVIERLRSKGVRVAVDDYGAGFATLQYLRRLPIDEVKIDRGLIQDVMTVDRDRTIVRAIIRLAHELGLDVVAEGVEDSRTLELLRELRCDVVQGFALGRPVPASHLTTGLGIAMAA